MQARRLPSVLGDMRLSIILVAVTACVPPQPTPSYYSAPEAEPAQANSDGAPATVEARRPRSITINGARLTRARAETLARLEIASHGSLPDGAYWYDPVNGSCGVWGQPGAAILPAGLDLGPPLPANASAGTSGVYINNRQLQHGEVQFLSALVGVQWQPGRYFIDAQGNAGLEGGAVLVNLIQVAHQRGRVPARRSGGSRVDDLGDFNSTLGFGEQKTHFFSSADGSCKTFESNGSTIYIGC